MPFTSRLQWIYELPRGNCDHMAEILESLGNPHTRYPIIHVAGTNGKGSVATKIAYGLQCAGLRVGLYTSPHITSIRERIRVNGEMISEESFCADPIENATFFEAITAIGFAHFAREKVDVAVIETGIGGRLDATNIVSPCLSVITSIALDHQDRLGDTLDAIAFEKAGIIKPGVPVVLGAKAQRAPIFARAKEQNAPTLCGIMSDGFYDDENNEIASIALKELQKRFPITDAIICEAMRARPRCRFEVIERPPATIVLDIAHNPDALENLYRAISLKLPAAPIRTYLGQSPGRAPMNALAARHGEVIPYNREVVDLSFEGIILFAGTARMMEEVRALLGFADIADRRVEIAK